MAETIARRSRAASAHAAIRSTSRCSIPEAGHGGIARASLGGAAILKAHRELRNGTEETRSSRSVEPDLAAGPDDDGVSHDEARRDGLPGAADDAVERLAGEHANGLGAEREL